MPENKTMEINSAKKIRRQKKPKMNENFTSFREAPGAKKFACSTFPYRVRFGATSVRR